MLSSNSSENIFDHDEDFFETVLTDAKQGEWLFISLYRILWD